MKHAIPTEPVGGVFVSTFGGRRPVDFSFVSRTTMSTPGGRLVEDTLIFSRKEGLDFLADVGSRASISDGSDVQARPRDPPREHVDMIRTDEDSREIRRLARNSVQLTMKILH